VHKDWVFVPCWPEFDGVFLSSDLLHVIAGWSPGVFRACFIG